MRLAQKHKSSSGVSPLTRERKKMDGNKTINKKHKIAFLVYIVAILAILCAANAAAINDFLKGILHIFRPVINGLVIAYLCNPIFRFFERGALSFVRAPRLRRMLSLLLSYLTLALAVALLLLLILPQIFDSIIQLATQFDAYVSAAIYQFNNAIDSINRFVLDLTGKKGFLSYIDENLLNRKVSAFFGEGNENLIDYLQSIDFGGLIATVSDTFSIVTDFIFGIFVSIYLLSSKEKRSAQIKKLRHAMLGERANAYLLRLVSIAKESFAGFLRGKALASLIVGLLFYAVASLLRLPYAILISTIMTVMNMIPIIGPIIGAVPSLFIILLTAPEKALLFLLLVVLFQQLDINVISPKILGSNLGISPLCVMIAVTVMGSLWGLAGMLLGVPLFATVLEFTERIVMERLQSRGLPAGVGNYYAPGSVMGPSEQLQSRSSRLLSSYEKKLLRLRKKELEQKAPTYTRGERFLLRLNSVLTRIGFRLPESPDIHLQFSAEMAAGKAAKQSEAEFCRRHECACSEDAPITEAPDAEQREN